ncbi:MAG: hypothetical protein Q9191_000600 [Dirinaria sp. TL-2023a]
MASNDHATQVSSEEPVPAVADPVTPNPKRSKADSNGSSVTSDQDLKPATIEHANSIDHKQEKELTDAELRAQYPPDDARAMSPRRSSAETDQLMKNAKTAIHKHAQNLQSSLNEIADQIEVVRADHEKLERDNQELQNYIGGLTRSISSTSLGSGKSKK